MTARIAIALVTLTAVVYIIATIGTDRVPLYLWNASESVPTGLYRLQPAGKLTVTNLVAVRPPEPLAAFLADGGYLPRGVPMLKRVLALPGQTVCREGLAITVDSIPVGEAQERDRRGRPLPVWQGCRIIAAGELFVMNTRAPDSLDSRYFGPIPVTAVTGRALPVWTDGEE